MPRPGPGGPRGFPGGRGGPRGYRPPGRPRGPGGPGFHRPPPPPPGGPYRRGCLPGCLLYVLGLAGMIGVAAALVLAAF